MYLKVAKGIVAVCDRELLGRKFEEGKLVLDLKKASSFYKGRIGSREEVMKALRNAKSVNLVGEKAVEAGIASGLIKKENVIKIDGIAHAQAYFLEQ